MKIIFCFIALLSLAPDFLIAQSSSGIESPVPLPIHAWIGPPANQTKFARYRELADAGFTHSFSGFPNADAMEKALDIAKAAGIKLFVHIPELKNDPEGTAKRFKDHPAVAGYHLRDEPNAKDFPELAGWVKRIRAVDDDHFCYINLFPNYASGQQLGTPSYSEHVDAFVETVPVKVLSFDHYPVTDRGIRPEWYENLEIISKAARKAGKPFWAFALAVAHDPYPVPSIAHLKLQVYSNLAYGAQGIQYFTYWTPVSKRWNFHEGPIESNGKRTVVYDRIKQVNREIHALSGVFLGARVLSVGHAGEFPRGTKPFEIMSPFQSISTGEMDAVISWLENDGRKYLLVVNRDMENPVQLSTRLEKGKEVMMVQKTGDLIPASQYNEIMVSPGDAALFTW